MKPILSLEQGTTSYRACQVIGWAVFAAFVIWLPFGASETDVGLFSDSMAFAVAVMGLNIVSGLSGQVSLGHSAFMGTGAFTTAILVADHDWSFFATVPVAALLCFAVGIIVGVPALRLKGLYLALATLGLSIIFPKVVEKYDFTGGTNGKRLGRKRLVPPEWTQLDRQSERHVWIYFLVLAITVVLFVIARNLFRSRPGRALIALRDNPIGAEVSGIDLARYKVVAFGLSSAYAGIAGSLLMFRSDIAAGSSYSLNRSIALITGLVLGGLATIIGPVIGGLVVVWLPKLIEDRIHGDDPREKSWSTIFYGASLIAIMFAYPGGLAGLIRSIRTKLVTIRPRIPTRRGSAPEEAEFDAVTAG
ncbi:MAG TPA: branched-chain amino acid ABC transporter permease [Acidimicrobiales bacterium]|nr:branched-chain amino acid ABC transporter permease [Acidimicrobiales bacterium]